MMMTGLEGSRVGFGMLAEEERWLNVDDVGVRRDGFGWYRFCECSWTGFNEMAAPSPRNIPNFLCAVSY